MSVPPFAYVTFKPCGCVAQAATPAGMADMMRNRFFKEQMQAGKVRTVFSREEWLALPWKCAVCRPELFGGKEVTKE